MPTVSFLVTRETFLVVFVMRLLKIILLLFSSPLFLVICLPSGSYAKTEKVTIIDSVGREIDIKADPKVIVPLSISALEVLCILGKTNTIVATTDYIKGHAIMFPFIKNIPSLGQAYTPDMERLVNLKPDLIITWFSNPGPEFEERLNPFGIDVLRINFSNPDEMVSEIIKFSRIFGPEAMERAERFKKFATDHENSVKSRIKQRKSIPTLVIEQTLKYRVAGLDSGVSKLARILDVKNYGDLFPQGNAVFVDPEWVPLVNPEYILDLFNWRGNETPEERLLMAEELKAELLSRPGWEDVEAIKNKNVFVMDVDVMGGPRYLLGLYQLAHFVYPDIFGADEWKNVEKEYFDIFLKDEL
jgi:iron complex transport system substrate-binding protein